MSIAKKWSHYTRENINRVPNVIGYYEIAHVNKEKRVQKILYQGEGILKNRLLAHLSDGKRPEEIVVAANAFRFEITNSKEISVRKQNILLKDHHKKHGKLPKFNKRSKN